MNTVTVNGSTLTVEPHGMDKVWSMTKQLEVPLDHVRGATYDPGANSEPKGMRRPGLHVPGKTSGTFVQDDEKIFWNVSDPNNTVVIELNDDEYARLILSVDKPREVVDEINQAVHA